MRIWLERSTRMSKPGIGVVVRFAGEEDLAKIVELQLDLGEHHREMEPDNPRYQIDRPQWESLIHTAFKSGTSTFLVAVSDAEICGFVRFSMVDKPWGVGCEMDTLVVAPKVRGKGVGRELVEHAEAAARDAGARAIRANVLSKSTRGKQFYVENGYSEIAVRFGKPLE